MVPLENKKSERFSAANGIIGTNVTIGVNVVTNVTIGVNVGAIFYNLIFMYIFQAFYHLLIVF